MSKRIRKIAKGGIAVTAVSAMALAGATPAMAEHRDRSGIDAGDVIAGALIIGGIAAIASAASRDRGRYDYRSNRYGHGNSRAAVERCVSAVERDLRRAGYRFAEVTQIRDVDRERRGWEVEGRLIVSGDRGYGYRGERNRYDDRRYDDRRYDYGHGYGRGADKGKFKCEIRGGRVTYIDYQGIRGLG